MVVYNKWADGPCSIKFSAHEPDVSSVSVIVRINEFGYHSIDIADREIFGYPGSEKISEGEFLTAYAKARDCVMQILKQGPIGKVGVNIVNQFASAISVALERELARLNSQQEYTIPADLTGSVEERIRAIRELRGITQAEMAKSLGLALMNYWKLENGRTQITITRLNDIAKVLNVSPIEFFRP